MNSDEEIDKFNDTIEEIAENLNRNVKVIDHEKIIRFLELLIKQYTSNLMVFVYGAGRSGFIGRCFAQRLMHLGIKSCFISDAVTYRYKAGDLLLIISGSGETTTSLAIAKEAREIGGKIVTFTANPLSSIGQLSTLTIQIEGKTKDIAGMKETLAPYTSLFDISTLSVLDSIGGVLMRRLGVSEKQIDSRHASLE